MAALKEGCMEETENNSSGKKLKFYKLITKKYKKIMNKISDSVNGTNNDDDDNYIDNNEIIDFVEYSNLKYRNNNLISKYQAKTYQDTVNLIENLLTLEEDLATASQTVNYEKKSINDLNKYTTYIELDKIKFNKSKFLSLFLHFNILSRLEKNKVINWHTSTAAFYPVKTIGDGNCLCHAVLIYLIGCHDSSLVLRAALRNYINGVHANAIKERFILHRKLSDASNSIQTEERQLEQEWKEIQSMIKIEKVPVKSGSTSSNDDTNATTQTQTKIQEKTVESLVYLEDIHIFALANLLKRTIIVVALDKIKDLQPSNIRGIYLPVLNKPTECVKEPILITFHNFHFCPLLYANYDEKLNKIAKNENFDTLFNQSNEVDLIKFSEKYDKKYLYFPIVYHNYEGMKVHFLLPNEEKKLQDIYSDYLNIIEIPCKLDNNEEIPFCCCKIGTNKLLKNNGLTTYLSYLVERLKGFDDTLDVPDYQTYGTIRSVDSRKSRSSSRERLKCVTRDCRNESSADYGGYCERCYRSKHSNQLVQVPIENRTKVQILKRCAYPDCERKALSPSYLCEFHRLSKCSNPNCSADGRVEYSGYCKSCYLSRTIASYDICKSANCQRYAINGYSGYCNECFSNYKCSVTECKKIATVNGYCNDCYLKYKNSQPKLCKIKNCENTALIDDYCSECYLMSNKVNKNYQDVKKCRFSSCKNLSKTTEGYCIDCFTTVNSTYEKCKSSNCSSFTNKLKNDGFCDKCHDLRKLYTKSYDKCSSSNCTEPATNSGYCSKCFKQRYANTCRNKTCINTVYIDGYCVSCYPTLQTRPTCNTLSCKNQVYKDGYCENCYLSKQQVSTPTVQQYLCSKSDCSNIINKANDYCDKCKEKFERQRAISSSSTVGISNGVPIPIKIERHDTSSPQNRMRTSVQTDGPYSFTTPRMVSSALPSVYNNYETLYVPTQTPRSTCKLCEATLPQYLRQNNQILCNRCMSTFHRTYGRHYNEQLDDLTTRYYTHI